MNTKKPLLSIIVVSYNTESITKRCLQSVYTSLKDTSFPYEVIVVDNNSKDGSLSMLKKWKTTKNTHVIENKENAGFGKANNQAAKKASGEYLLLLNSDTVTLDNAIGDLLTFYKKNEDHIHFLGGKLLNSDMSEQPSCGPFYSLPVVFAALFLRGDYWGLTRSSPKKIKETDWVSGACILTKKSYYEDLNGMDEGIFMYMEEIDLLYRAKQRGYRVFFYPEAQFIHAGSASSKGRTYPILQVYRGFLYFYRKHYGPISTFFLRIMLKLKALAGVSFGYFLNNQYLKKTYGEALKMA